MRPVSFQMNRLHVPVQSTGLLLEHLSVLPELPLLLPEDHILELVICRKLYGISNIFSIKS